MTLYTDNQETGNSYSTWQGNAVITLGTIERTKKEQSEGTIADKTTIKYRSNRDTIKGTSLGTNTEI